VAADHALAWLNLALRWGHVITGIAWIGTSFYFNWLNSRVAPPPAGRAEPGVAGELWSVHGGGFYRMVKYAGAPAQLPGTLHWFKWEAYATWLTGVSLLALIYYLQADAFLVAPGRGLAPGVVIAIGVGALVVPWVVYDVLCRSPLGGQPALLAVLGLVLVTALAWGLTQLMSARAAYLHVGAALGTIMAANVLMVIIPSQRHMVAAMAQGRSPDAARSRQAALRSLHNNYLTLPVLFVMVSNHYPTTYGSRLNWEILLGLSVLGALTRHWFNLRNQGRRAVWILPAATLGMVLLAFVSQPQRLPAPPAGASAGVAFTDVRVVVARRCAACHSATPTMAGFAAAPAGVLLDTPEQIRSQAQRIEAVAVAAQTMPLGNVTGMTVEERELLGRWIREGARLR